MIKRIIILFIIGSFFPCIANATYHLDYFSIQNRVYENGNHMIQMNFDCVDANHNYPSTDILDSAVLTDPNGKNVDLKISFITFFELVCSYNANNSQWVYKVPYPCINYTSIISDQMIIGKYKLKITDKNGEISEMDYMVNQIVKLPIIPSNSYSFHLNQVGDLIWQWQVPDYIDPSLQTSVRAWVNIFDEKKTLIGELYYTIPTQMGFLSVPKSLLVQIVSTGTSFGFGTQVRTNDNNNRSYSTDLVIGN